MGGPMQQSTFVTLVVGGFTAAIFWALNTYFLMSHPIPADIASGITVGISALVTHFVPDTQPVAPATAPKA